VIDQLYDDTGTGLVAEPNGIASFPSAAAGLEVVAHRLPKI
jgi:hypothetical protein